ncbi:hypothetical protein AO366_0565 [Moraxella catarrhalis]|nr:hypothetical protein AO380_1500 [Moraxella catarrhalis]OAV12061.1 hypothetical protein AO378_0096 [Moraxella catarrhalis]OAV13389.1 hypothetical protein AO376_1568 [Moraxella catarrhalis]OAV18925.1 hypothetical protein AO374_0744 [Moraxella catarrhalis]OAV31943.1 hypothetical protein AO367_0463 [Moraxella catarrhalis]
MSDFLSQAHTGFYPHQRLGNLNHALTCRQSGAFSRLY